MSMKRARLTAVPLEAQTLYKVNEKFAKYLNEQRVSKKRPSDLSEEDLLIED
jgi:hypothetical protein